MKFEKNPPPGEREGLTFETVVWQEAGREVRRFGLHLLAFTNDSVAGWWLGVFDRETGERLFASRDVHEIRAYCIGHADGFKRGAWRGYDAGARDFTPLVFLDSFGEVFENDVEKAFEAWKEGEGF